MHLLFIIRFDYQIWIVADELTLLSHKKFYNMRTILHQNAVTNNNILIVYICVIHQKIAFGPVFGTPHSYVHFLGIIYRCLPISLGIICNRLHSTVNVAGEPKFIHFNITFILIYWITFINFSVMSSLQLHGDRNHWWLFL